MSYATTPKSCKWRFLGSYEKIAVLNLWYINQINKKPSTNMMFHSSPIKG